MFNLSEQFHDQYTRLQQQYSEQWTPFEQFYSTMELSKKLQLHYRYFLTQFLLHVNLQQENNEMFNHTVHQANTPAILACLLSDPLDKIISTIQLYLPLLSLTTTNEKLLEAYRDVFLYLDSKLVNPTNFSYSEKQLIQFCQQIRYFIQNNPSLQKFLNILPQLTALANSSITLIQQGKNEENSISLANRHHQPLQRYPSVRSSSHPSPPSSNPPTNHLMSLSEGSTTLNRPQQFIHKDVSDSGVDLSENGINNSVQNLLSHALVARSNSSNLTLPNGQDPLANHPFVGKTTSSPVPEQSKGSNSRPTMIPLSAVLSAPAPSVHSFYSDFRSNQSQSQQQQQQQQGTPTLTISDEDEEDQQQPTNLDPNSRPIDTLLSEMNTGKRLQHFCSLRERNTRVTGQQMNNNTGSVSQYLGVDGNADSVRNTFIQPNSGMRDVPKWLKNLRLHKYAFFFSQMTYDQMMNLTIDQLKEGKITDGACTKILLNIKKLKERPAMLQKLIIDIDRDQIDMKNVLQQLHELMLTPIRAKQNETGKDNEEDLPSLIMQVLEKVYQRLTVNTSSTSILSDMCNNLVGLFDRCYKHEAFSAAQRHTLLHWRGPLCNKLQTSGKIEFKSMQSSSSSSSMNRRVQLKPQTSMGNMSSSQISKPVVRSIKSNAPYYQNYSTSSIPLSRQHHSDATATLSNNNESNIIRRPVRSPTLVFTTTPTPSSITNENRDHHLSIVTSHSLQEQSTMSSPAFISERSGFGTGNLRPSNQYLTSTPQRSNAGYLAANDHQLLTRKTSIGPYGDQNRQDKTKLCKTFSDPSKIRFYNPNAMNNLQSPSNPSPISSQNNSTGYATLSSSYSPQRTFLSHTEISSIQANDSEKENSVFYGSNENHPNETSSSDVVVQTENSTHDQRHNSTEFDSLCRQITASALGDDVPDSSTDPQEEYSAVQTKAPSSSSSTDIEQ